MNGAFPLSFPLALAWALGAATLLQVVLAATVAFRPAAATDVVNIGACEALVFVVMTFGVLRLHGSDAPSRRSLGLRPTHPGLSVLALGLGLAVHFPAESIRALQERYFPTPSEVLAARAALLSADTPVQLAAVMLVIACVGPLVEEVFFRGALFGSLRRSHSLLGATIVTSVCFVIGHLDVRAWAPLVLVAFVITHLRAASGSLLPPLAMHVGFNTVAVLSVATGASSIGKPMDLSPGALIGGWAVTAGLVFAVQYVAAGSDDAAAARAEDAE